MTELFRNKYRIPSARAEWWDYGNNAAYFVTICTQNRDHFFGGITAPEMRLILTLPGAIAQACWLEIPEHFPFVRLDAFVVMPNHVHGILVIDKIGAVDTVETRFIASLPPPIPAPLSLSSLVSSSNPRGGFAGNRNPVLNQDLARIVRWYKGRTSFEARKVQSGFAWQPRYHDHIIRGAKAYQRISTYMLNNPARWKDDQFFSTPD